MRKLSGWDLKGKAGIYGPGPEKKP